MPTKLHMAIDIQGFIEHEPFPRGYEIFRDGSNTVEPDVARNTLFDLLRKGHRLFPLCSCEGFDPFGGGCPGHEMN
jgi:hypothetical protein